MPGITKVPDDVGWRISSRVITRRRPPGIEYCMCVDSCVPAITSAAGSAGSLNSTSPPPPISTVSDSTTFSPTRTLSCDSCALTRTCCDAPTSKPHMSNIAAHRMIPGLAEQLPGMAAENAENAELERADDGENRFSNFNFLFVSCFGQKRVGCGDHVPRFPRSP